MAVLTTLQLPIDWPGFGLPDIWQAGSTCLTTGDPAWSWDIDTPPVGVPVTRTMAGVETPGWGLDTVVMLAPDLDTTIARFERSFGSPRLRVLVENRPTVYYRVGPILEIIESPVRDLALFGVVLVTTLPLDEVAIDWRQRGHRVTDPHAAIQPGRQIITVKGTSAGLAVVSPDGPVRYSPISS